MLELIFDNCVDLNDELKEYLCTIDGIKDITFNHKNNSIKVVYDSSLIPTKMIKKEIDIFSKKLETPNLWGFNKFSKQAVSKTLIIKRLCCEYCLNIYIEDLFENDAISYASSDFDFSNYENVKINIKYNPNMINDNDIAIIEDNINK